MATPPDLSDRTKSGPSPDKEKGSIEDLGARIAKARQGGLTHAGNQATSQGLGKGWRLASELVASLMVACALGYGLDRLLGSLPLFLLIGLGIGFAAGILNVQRAMKEMAGQSASPEDDNKTDA